MRDLLMVGLSLIFFATQILETLAGCRPCLTYEIVETTPLAQATVSQHLKALQEAGLVRGEAEGTATCYWLDMDGIRWLKDQIECWLRGCCVPSAPRHMVSLPGQVCGSRFVRV